MTGNLYLQASCSGVVPHTPPFLLGSRWYFSMIIFTNCTLPLRHAWCSGVQPSSSFRLSHRGLNLSEDKIRSAASKSLLWQALRKRLLASTSDIVSDQAGNLVQVTRTPPPHPRGHVATYIGGTWCTYKFGDQSEVHDTAIYSLDNDTTFKWPSPP